MIKLLTTALALTLLVPALPSQARTSQRGYSNQCFQEVYREEYVPGTELAPGRVRRWTESKEVPCDGSERVDTYLQPAPRSSSGPVDDNSCVEGAIIGGLGGGALGGTLATQNNWVWSIPAGIIGGAMVGCQIDGGKFTFMAFRKNETIKRLRETRERDERRKERGLLLPWEEQTPTTPTQSGKKDETTS